MATQRAADVRAASLPEGTFPSVIGARLSLALSLLQLLDLYCIASPSRLVSP